MTSWPSEVRTQLIMKSLEKEFDETDTSGDKDYTKNSLIPSFVEQDGFVVNARGELSMGA